MADTAKTPHLISLSGHGEVKQTPDMAIVSLGTQTQAATAKAAVDANTKNMTALLAALKAAGIDDKDVQTSNFSVGPRYDYSNNQAPKLVGYDVNNTVIVTVRKLDELGALLDKAVGAGSNQITGISFSVANPQAAEDEARKAAVKDALRKATLLAEAAGTKLGAIASISENASAPPVPVVFAKRGMAMDAAAAPVPVAQGEMAISADVNIVWELE